MSIFTDAERRFLVRHGFSEDEIHDGRFDGKRSRELAAKKAGKILVLTSSPCRAAGHRIRTRAGHCAQCDPKKISFVSRETEEGYVYIAGSLSGRMIKIGMAGDLWQREGQMRAEKYGGYSDWLVLFSSYVNNAGEKERQIGYRVQGEQASGTYYKDGNPQRAAEMFRCPLSSALRAFDAVLGGIDIESVLKRHPRYEFDSE